MRKFRLSIISKEGEVFNGDADMVVVPGSGGQLGITAGHTPFISPVKAGKIRVKSDGQTVKVFNAKEGFVEISEEEVLLLI